MIRHFLRLTSILTLNFLLALILGELVFVSGTFIVRPDLSANLSRLVKRESTLSLTPTATTSLPSLTPAASLSESLASCLAREKFTMYGIEECPSCQLEKSYFGPSFALIPYVDCSQNREICRSKNIRSYPTWEDKNGVQYKGAIPLEKLAELAGCPKP